MHASGRNAAMFRLLVDDPRLFEISRASLDYFLHGDGKPYYQPLGSLLLGNNATGGSLRAMLTGSFT